MSDIPPIFHFFQKKVLYWLSLILVVCAGFLGGHRGYAGVHPHTRYQPHVTRIAQLGVQTSNIPQLSLKEFWLHFFLPPIFHEYSTFFGPFVALMLPELSYRACLGRGCAMGGYPPQVPTNCHWWRWDWTCLDLIWQQRENQSGIKVEFWWNIPLLTLRLHISTI